ncbi:thiamine biosynthesis protein [Rhodococcus sp. Leaf7]|uniref:FAD:protein FMN transferase n=1 Tax=unclassified Rhodococcus (in: high G+C Gram-positive bacteria) TaxID=192944 RepID=UPI0006FB28B9|nr:MULTISPECIES: FAD:protein FMN transferase [unclassified Rhodococcus (in: high G+C Gram-positive bacteria)]KQU06675.1 thiamine biosynthesis protein [Rhodococcus sp. Leaf7]KQU42195.1 thiamine biosynthesis protein [Rhodococcus sp. Leaf247]
MTTRAWVEQIMGLPISLHVRAADTDRDDIADAVADAFTDLRRADAVFSTWRADSDVMRCRAGTLTLAAADPTVLEVESLCRRAVQETGGIFTTDLVGPDGSRGFDPTGVVKAWAVSRAVRSLAGLDGLAYALNAGGDIVFGTGRDGQDFGPWRIGIQDPTDRGRIADTVSLTVGAVATSSSAERGGHIVDPITDQPVKQDFSTTVVGPDLVWADIWATATFVDPTALNGRDAWTDYGLLITDGRR